MTTEQMYSRKQIAAMLEVDVTTVYRWEKQGMIAPVMHVNGRPRYSLKSLEKTAKAPPQQIHNSDSINIPQELIELAKKRLEKRPWEDEMEQWVGRTRQHIIESIEEYRKRRKDIAALKAERERISEWLKSIGQ
jgi:DNA-binding transcriptional MerR regulator